MKPAPYEYCDPSTVEEVIGLLGEFGDEAKLLAGGQSLVPMLNFRLARPSQLVDINRVSELAQLRRDEEALVIGALTRQRALERSELTAGAWSLLPEGLRYVGHAQIRNRGTVGGSLAHGDPAAELPAAVTALGGQLILRGPGGEREVPASEFFQGFFTTALAPDELLTEVRIPTWPSPSGAAFVEVSRRHGDFAQVAVGAAVALGDDGRVVRAGVAVAGVGGRPVSATDLIDGLVGEQPTSALIRQLADEFAAGLTPASDIHGSADYRRHLARHLVPQALEEAIRRAGMASDKPGPDAAATPGRRQL
jgi:carbon-monoxide dehydrogenase medium subunit